MPQCSHHNSVNATIDLSPNEVHIGHLTRLPFIVFDRSYGGVHQSLDPDQFSPIATSPVKAIKCANELVRKQQALNATRVSR